MELHAQNISSVSEASNEQDRNCRLTVLHVLEQYCQSIQDLRREHII